jgi:hemerythrin-like domain-containing protein
MFFNYPFYVFVLYVLFSTSHINVFFIASHHVYNCLFLFVYNFTDNCHRVATELQLINIISYNTHSYIRAHTRTYKQEHEPLRARIHTHAGERTSGH